MTEAKTNARQVWEQLEGETNEAYARFLAYRDLGPARSVLWAYTSTRLETSKNDDKPPQSVPKAWWQNYRAFQWKDRATAWDISQMAKAVPEAATTIFRLMSETARTCLGEVAHGNIKPQNFAELKEMVVTLGNFISPEVIRTTIDHAGNAEDSDRSRNR